VGNSGTVIRGQLIASHPVGHELISGGVTGPEGSVLVFPIVALAAGVILFTFSSSHLDGQEPKSTDPAPPDSGLN